MSDHDEVVTFVPFTTAIDPLFWSEVSKRKVNEWQLVSEPIQLRASFSSCIKQPSGILLTIGHGAFDTERTTTGLPETQNFERLYTDCGMVGEFLLTNTKKQFVEELNRKQISENCGEKIWKAIVSKEWLKSSNILNTFFLTAYADVKQFVYYYWNCIPALLYPNNIVGKTQAITANNENLFQTAISYLKDVANNSPITCDVFIIVNKKGALPLIALDDSTLECNDVTLVSLNGSNLPHKAAWTIRNLISAVAYLKPSWTNLRVLALRRQLSESFLLEVNWQLPPTVCGVPACVGWERDQHGALGFRKTELKILSDPLKVMEESADLNLKLIRWRQAPSIDLDRFTKLQALIIGSGTLGCNLARSLLGWGVRNFTFIDHATVSYNNPIRQSLFTFADCQCESGQYNKARAAADSLKRIYPRVNANGVDMKIPMPGHSYSPEEKLSVLKTCDELNTLICEHDVVFLVMDSRESRWLPTLIAACRNKLAFTVALGFDSYVIMRHGAAPMNYSSTPNYNNEELNLNAVVDGIDLGCYFCNDVTAPGNSVADRTLDQQCTISRSGISMIASGMAVELMASVLQHELGQGAPALLADVDENSSILGGTPHQLRGFVSRFHQMTPTVRRFEKCTACGDEVRRRYLAPDHFDIFLHPIFQDSRVLEQLTGLTDLQQSVDQLHLDMLEIDDNDDSI